MSSAFSGLQHPGPGALDGATAGKKHAHRTAGPPGSSLTDFPQQPSAHRQMPSTAAENTSTSVKLAALSRSIRLSRVTSLSSVVNLTLT
jgi:hypothetical protein